MHAPGTIWRRALRRVERRALAYNAAARSGHAFQRSNAARLLHEACRLADRLAYCAGIAGPLAR